MEKRYPIHERFMTWQGEGQYLGLPAFFIRTFGCGLRCHFCDSAGTWHPTYVPKHVDRMTSAELCNEIRGTNARFVVLTGGEPAMHDLEPLVVAIDQELNLPSHIETSGAYSFTDYVYWVTLSPKRAKLPLMENILKADEFKLIIEEPADIEYYTEVIAPALAKEPIKGRFPDVWLHPEWSQRNNPKVLRAISAAVIENKHAYRAGWQMHKLYNVDALDARTKPLVPLGGDPAKGY